MSHVRQHIIEAFDSVEPGVHLTVAQIYSFESTIRPRPSRTAITARLFPIGGKTDLPSYIAPALSTTGVRGAVKAHTWEIQTGKDKSAYKTRYTVTSEKLHSSRASLLYESVLVHSGYKKRLLRDGKVITRDIT